MKKWMIVVALLAGFCCVAGIAVAENGGDVETHRECAHCGMDRKAYGYSRMLVEYNDGSQVGVCSLHCAVTELNAGNGRKVKAVLVADRDTRKLLAADKAIWVIGGSKRGVMTRTAKWAFAAKAGADSFVKANGGTISTWEGALAAAQQEVQKIRR